MRHSSANVGRESVEVTNDGVSSCDCSQPCLSETLISTNTSTTAIVVPAGVVSTNPVDFDKLPWSPHGF